jgi:hypothetical protein
MENKTEARKLVMKLKRIRRNSSSQEDLQSKTSKSHGSWFVVSSAENDRNTKSVHFAPEICMPPAKRKKRSQSAIGDHRDNLQFETFAFGIKGPNMKTINPLMHTKGMAEAVNGEPVEKIVLMNMQLTNDLRVARKELQDTNQTFICSLENSVSVIQLAQIKREKLKANLQEIKIANLKFKEESKFLHNLIDNNKSGNYNLFLQYINPFLFIAHMLFNQK